MKDTAKPRHGLDIAGKTNPQSIESNDRGRQLYNIYHKVLFQASMSPETANDGLYVTTNPRLGLGVVEQDQIEIA